MHSEPTPSELMGAIVDLQEAVGRGFARNDAQFVEVNSHLARVDGRLERLDERLTSVEGELKGIHRWIDRRKR